ncbi:MAG: 50S ribosomal protein L11 methyltransferase [Lachnospiraceae bacterium]|nr:50S ribosomal protein L11 methyltransferase [Lachnospiraceae bacterium]
MKWMRFRVRTNAASEDIIVSAMADIGLYGAQIEDKVPLSGRELEELFIDEAPVQAIADDNGEADLACLNFFVEIEEDRLKLSDEETVTPEELKARMREALDELRQFSDIGDGTISISVTEDIDWRDNWKQYFHKFYIDDVLVLPSWEEMSDEDRDRAAHVLHIDPGAAFGTGLHETTRLAVQALRRAVTERNGDGSTVLDVGTGSGVLSILALMFGAASAVGVDLDPLAILAADENRDRNGFGADRMRALKGDLIGDDTFRSEILGLCAKKTGYDIVVANILPNVLVPLTPVVPELIASDGILIYSGILQTKADEVSAALSAAGFAVEKKETLGEWCSLLAKRA